MTILNKVMLSYSKETPSTFQTNSINTLPELWTVVSLGLSSDLRWLLVTRLAQKRDPIVIRIPLLQTNEEETENKIVLAQDKLGSLVEISHEPKKENLPESEWKKWWENRRKKDDSLRDLLGDMEEIFGCWKGMLLAPFVEDNLNDSIDANLDTVKENIVARLKRKPTKGKKSTEPVIDDSLLWLCMYSLPVLSSAELSQLLAAILPTTSENDLAGV
jgi:separase